jgi:hypothetical protein
MARKADELPKPFALPTAIHAVRKSSWDVIRSTDGRITPSFEMNVSTNFFPWKKRRFGFVSMDL